jgi:ABC-2 type transport system permease protein
MKGLILKDFYVIRDALLIPIMMMIVLGIALSVVRSPWLLILIAGTSFGMMAITTIQSDKTAQWDKFSATLPVSRAQSVSSKYCMYVILSLFGILIGTVICIVASMFKSGFDSSAFVINLYFALILAFLPPSVNIPCSYVLEGEKSIAGLILSYVVTGGAFAGLQKLLAQFMSMEENMLLVHGIVAAVSVAAFLLSWIIFPKWLSRREL